jgi:hypothetical protein
MSTGRSVPREDAMLLHCESAPQPATGDWLREDTLASLRELNEECLELCAAQGRAHGGHATLTEIARLWRPLDAAARARASDCLYLLADAGFACGERWRCTGASQVDEAAPGYAPFFTLPAAAAVAQAVLTFAWHLARCQATAARLLLCMPASGVADLAQLTLGQVRALAVRHPHWLQPRWAQRPAMWQELLGAAASGDVVRLERARLRGQRLLAAELRGGPPAAQRRASDHRYVRF